MLQALLTTYLSIVAAMGPTLCCCSVELLIPGVGAAASCYHDETCVSPTGELSAKTSHLHHHDSSVNHPYTHRSSPAHHDSEPQGPCQHGHDGCPCGHSQGSAIAAAADANGIQNLKSHFFVWAIAIQVEPLAVGELEGGQWARIGSKMPAGLFGTAMLRAHSRLQC